MKPWLRWVLVLPAAVGAYAGAQVLVIIGSLIGFFDGGDTWAQFIGSILCPAAFVWFGSKSAPSHRLLTAICLAVLLSMLLYWAAQLLSDMGVTRASNVYVWTVICDLASILSSILTCYAIYEQEKNARTLREWSEIQQGPDSENSKSSVK